MVFGASGSIGSGIVTRLLLDEKISPLPVIRPLVVSMHPQRFEHLSNIMGCEYLTDVTNEGEVEGFASLLNFRNQTDGELDGVVYTIGHCPPQGFLDAVSVPLSQLPLRQYKNEIALHQLAVLNVFQEMLKNVKDGGCFLFLSSAITRHKGKLPSFLHAHYHASVIAAEDWLIDGMRHDTEVIERGIKIHRIAPGAVDTPFHIGGPKPPKMISVADVAEEVYTALHSDTHVDKELI